MSDTEQGDGIPTSNGEGWDYFAAAADKAVKEARERAEMEQREIDRAFARIAATPDGQIMLQTMQAWVDGMEDFNPALGFHNGAAFGFWRTGNRNFFKLIKTTIARGGKA